MKRSIFVGVVLITSMTLVGAGCKKSPTNQEADSSPASSVDKQTKEQRYEVETGKVMYVFEGMKTGTEELKFKDYGWKEVARSNTTLSFGGGEENQLRILDGYTQYSVDLTTNKGTKIENTILQQLAENNTEDSLTALGEKMLEEMGAQKSGTKTVAGHECTIWEIASAGTTQCVYKGVTLEIITDFAGISITQRATSVEFGGAIPDSEFELPEGVEIGQSLNTEDLLKNL